MVVPLLAAKGSQNASKSLTGDIYVRRWSTVKGKGKKAKVVDHELHVNPVSVLGGVLLGMGAAATAAVGLWLTQQKVGKKVDANGEAIAKSKVRYARLYEGVFETVDTKIVDSPGHYEIRMPTGPHGSPYRVWVPEVSHIVSTQTTVRKPRCVVYTDRMIPIRTISGVEGVEGIIWFSQHEAAQGWAFAGSMERVKDGTDQLGGFVQYKQVLKNDNKARYGLSERKGFGEGGLF